MSPARGLTLVAAALLLSACASGREFAANGQPVYWPGEVDVAPKLLGCSGYDPVPTVGNGSTRFITAVSVSLVVNPEGSVEPQSLRRATDPRAQSLARGCFYTPAELGGESVYVRTTVIFRLDNLNMKTAVP